MLKLLLDQSVHQSGVPYEDEVINMMGVVAMLPTDKYRLLLSK